MLFSKGKFHEIRFLKKYGTLYSLLEDLVTRRMTVVSANADQISLIIGLMHGCNEWSFDNKTPIDLEEGRFHNATLARANDIVLNTKKIQKRG